jgi:hypothetical protein
MGTRIEEERATPESSTVASGRRDTTVILVALVAVADVTAIDSTASDSSNISRGWNNLTSSLSVRNLKLVMWSSTTVSG